MQQIQRQEDIGPYISRSIAEEGLFQTGIFPFRGSFGKGRIEIEAVFEHAPFIKRDCFLKHICLKKSYF